MSMRSHAVEGLVWAGMLGTCVLGAGCTHTSGGAAPEVEHDGGVPDAGWSWSPPAWDAGVTVSPRQPPGLQDAADGAPDGAEGGAVSRCVPSATPDEPDDDFEDTNCDGIDGDERHAVFVSPRGSDDANGSIAAPVRTIQHAIAMATALNLPVYACNGEYDEAIRIDGDAPVQIFGGYACERSWRRVADRAVVVSPKGPALTIDRASGEIRIERFAFRAPAGTDPGEESVAATVARSTGVTLSRVEFEAQDGMPGAEGAPLPDPAWTEPTKAADALDTAGVDQCSYVLLDDYVVSGGPACSGASYGAAGVPRRCADGTEILGGWGGRGGNVAIHMDALDGLAGTPAAVDGSHDGTTGAAGATGAAGKGFGTIVDGRYVADDSATDGGHGAAGTAGPGGKGGRSTTNNGSPETRFYVGGGGGQGGYPGCGGLGGKAGRAGGASIALIIDTARVSLEWSRFVTGHGGDGGAPSGGQPGQPGGEGGEGGGGPSVNVGEKGHGGGDGGRGGTGGPGAGGPSIGVVYRGAAPTLTDAAFLLGSPGLGASGDTRAPDGLGKETYDVDQGSGN